MNYDPEYLTHNYMRPSRDDTRAFKDMHVSRNKFKDDRNETALSERRLAHVLFLVLGFSWLMLFAFDLDSTWYSIAIVVCWAATGFAIVYRWAMDVKNGVL